MLSLDIVQNKYKNLRFNSISESLEKILSEAEQNDFSYLQLADALVDYELKLRDKNRIRYNRKRSAFPMIKTLEEFDFRFQTTISKREISQLLDFQFIENRQNVIFIGPPGVGKTHLSIAVALKAIDEGYKVLFKTAMELIEILDLAEINGDLKKQIQALAKFDLLLIDELGYLPLHRQSMFNLFQLINHLYEFRSIILTTNKNFTDWKDFFVGENVAVPIVDRLIHHSRIFMLGGESYRLKSKMEEL